MVCLPVLDGHCTTTYGTRFACTIRVTLPTTVPPRTVHWSPTLTQLVRLVGALIGAAHVVLLT
jgi:hypothetical protein